ncbi:MAG TPA: hypothetical protein DEH78_17200 [Solibacterales bacterium]|nr:hypothetical protein [Bryobacterales bacterium]
MRYLLDTNIVSNLVRNPQDQVADRIREVGEAHVSTSIIVAAELRYGAAKKGSGKATTSCPNPRPHVAPRTRSGHGLQPLVIELTSRLPILKSLLP